MALAPINFINLFSSHHRRQVVLELAAYESFCKNQRDALKHSISLREKEASRQQHLDQMRQRSQQRGAQATNANLPAKGAMSKSATDVDELIKRFEMQKILDVKTILLNLTAIQLKQHAKAIELLSAAYQDIADIDEEKDVEVIADDSGDDGCHGDGVVGGRLFEADAPSYGSGTCSSWCY